MLNLSFLSSNIPAAVAAFAAAITAAYASLKYYSDKAAKVTDFRKAWIESLRLAVAEFSGSIHTIAGRIAIRTKADSERLADNAEKQSSLSRLVSFFGSSKPSATPVEKELATELLTHWAALRLSYNKIVLHLNPAEHIAYSLAETAIGKYTHSTAPDEIIRGNVNLFLGWCIELAQCRAYEVPRRGLFRKLQANTRPSFDSDKRLPIEILSRAQEKINSACIDPGSALLLAAFATRQLLHGSYKNVFDNINSIEKGIRVVDTSAAIVIKGVWENIKKGEPTYRWTSNIAMAFSLLLIFSILASLLMPLPSSQGTAKLFISCITETETLVIERKSNDGAVSRHTFDCERISPK